MSLTPIVNMDLSIGNCKGGRNYRHYGIFQRMPDGKTKRIATMKSENLCVSWGEDRILVQAMSALPELLLACDTLIYTGDLQTAIDLARKAIAKAEGE